MKWIDKKKIIIEKLIEYGYVENTYDTLTKEVEDSPMVAVVNLKVQPKPGEHIPVYFVDPENLDDGESYQDINGTLESTKQIIRNTVNSLEVQSNGSKDEQPKQKTESMDNLTKEPANVPINTTKQKQKPITAVQLTGSIQLTTDIVQQYINPDATHEQAFNFMAFCQAQKLDPFKHEAHLLVFKGKATNVIGVDGNVRRAQEQDDYDGYEAGIIVLDVDGNLEEREGTFMLKEETLLGGWCKVYRKNISHPFVAKVSLDEYLQRKADGQPNKIWATKPATMICKVPVSQCHRKAYAGINSGGYEQIEMQDLGEVELVE